jgi:fluoride exporter
MPEPQHNDTPARNKKHSGIKPAVIWLAVAGGGACGALMRFAWGALFPETSGNFPWAVFTENILGAFLLGGLLALFTGKTGNHQYIRSFFGTGMIGSFTTFSGITIDLAAFIHSDELFKAILYSISTVVAGLVAASIGLTGFRKIRRRAGNRDKDRRQFSV